MGEPANISSEAATIFHGSNHSRLSFLVPEEFLLPVGVVMFLENVISILLLCKCRRINFQIRILSLNLAISDLLTGGFLTLPNSINEYFGCGMKKYPTFLFINVSLLTVTLMNIDRCFVFAYPMRYYSFITEKVIKKICYITWITGFPLTYGMFFGFDAKYGFSCEIVAFHKMNAINSTFKGILLSLVILNFLMFGYFLHHSHKSLCQIHPQKTFNPMSKEYLRMVKKLSVVTGVFLAAYFPFMLIFTFPIFDKSSDIGKGLFGFTSVMVLLNSACNPVFYVWRFSEPRYHMKRWLCFWSKHRRETIDRLYNQQYASYEIQTIPA
jgi:hypothetical protein